MNKIILTLTLSLVFCVQGRSQDFRADSVSKFQISKLKFLTGKWEGTGWMMGRDQQRREFIQTENVQLKLDGTILLIEGLGKQNGTIIHNAMAIVSYNKTDNNYTFQSYLQNGNKGEFRAELMDDKLFWYPNENVRYATRINDSGQWHETGEFNRDGNWFQFFEMTLDREK